MRKYVLAVLLMLCAAGSASAAILTFDDLAHQSTLSNGYGGLSWTNMYAVPPDPTAEIDTGFRNSVVSPSNVITNGNGDAATISSPTGFNFIGAYFGSAYMDGLNVRISAFQSSSKVYDDTILLNTTGYSWYNFNLTDITSLQITATGGMQPIWNRFNPSTNFTMDNLTYSVDEEVPVPEPSTLLLLCAGVAGAMVLRRKLRRP